MKKDHKNRASRVEETCPYCGEVAYYVDEFQAFGSGPEEKSPTYCAYECCDCGRYHDRMMSNKSVIVFNRDYPLDVLDYLNSLDYYDIEYIIPDNYNYHQ